MIAKGGITSNDIATKGLGVKRAMVAGQLQPGIPVWKLGSEAKFPNMYYVVYPGNVGSESGLADAIKSFADDKRKMFINGSLSNTSERSKKFSTLGKAT